MRNLFQDSQTFPAVQFVYNRIKMKCIILAGGRGERLSEETSLRPKPLVEIGGMPILWHIMKLYSHHGVNEFVICCGYKGYLIKDFFANYFLHTSDVTIDLQNNSLEIHNQRTEPWKVTLVDTGVNTMTGARLKKVERYIREEISVCFTYGDGVSNIDITRLIATHKNCGRQVTVSAVKPPGRFGAMEISGNSVKNFVEKPLGDGGFINGGFFVINTDVIKKLPTSESLVWENEPLKQLARTEELNAYVHHGFWHPMDTLRDKNFLEGLWNCGNAPWKVW